MGDTYFANETGSQLAAAIMSRVTDWCRYLEDTGRLREMRDMANVFYGLERGDGTGTTRKVTRRGAKGEVVNLRLNHTGAIIRQIVTLVTGQQPAMEPKAANTDSAAQSQTILARGVLENDLKQRGLIEKLKTMVRHAAAYREGWLAVPWDDWLGPPVSQPGPGDIQRDPKTQEVVGVSREGNNRFINLTAIDVARDPYRPDAEHTWLIIRLWENRFDLAAKYRVAGAPVEDGTKDLSATILSHGSTEEERRYRLAAWTDATASASSKSDIIAVYHFFHLPTPAVPEGRHAVVLGDSVLEDGPLRYKEIPVYPLVPEWMDDGPDGHTSLLDMLAIQEGMDAAASAALTKMSQSLPRWFTSKSAAPSVKQLGKSGAIHQVNGELDKVVKLFQPATVTGDDLNFIGFLQKQQETLSGMNSVARGNPEQALKDGSGAALSLIQAQAIVSQSGLQGNYHAVMGKVGTCIIENHKTFNTTKRLLEVMAGVASTSLVRDFSGDDLRGVAVVSVESGNPIQQTSAGKMQLLQFLQELGVQLDAGRALAFLNTGRWEHAVEDMQTEEMAIRKENEALARGEMLSPPHRTENHIKHILGHREQMNSEDPVISANALNHALAHVQLWMMLEPALAAALGIPPPPMPMMPPGAPAAPGGPPGAPPEAGGQPPASSTPGESGMPSLPNQPNGTPPDPLTQQAAAQMGNGS